MRQRELKDRARASIVETDLLARLVAEPHASRGVRRDRANRVLADVRGLDFAGARVERKDLVRDGEPEAIIWRDGHGGA